MLWPADKIITHEDKQLECRDCHIFVWDLNTFNKHNCEKGRELNERNGAHAKLAAKAAQPQPVKPVEPEKKKLMLHQFC